MRLLRQKKIDTFAAIGDEGRNQKHAYRHGRVRCNATIKFMEKHHIRPKAIMDVAGPSVVGRWIAEYFSAELNQTYGDLDMVWACPNLEECDTILMLEVLEHIANPLWFFHTLHSRMTTQNMVVSWPCRNSLLWTDIHFHEMRLDRFEWLMDKAGFEIVAYKLRWQPNPIHTLFLGIRPFFRFFLNFHYIALVKKK